MTETAKATVTAADAAQVNAWLENDEILLVDVRETSEYEVEHISGALLLPLSSFDPELFPSVPEKKVVLHCAVGKRSEAAGKMLLKEGHRDVVHMEGGIEAWKAAGFATEVQILPPDAEKPKPVFMCPPPGRVLQEEYLDPLGISPRELALATGLLEGRVNDLLAGTSPIGVEASLRLARYFSTAGDFWIRLQLEHDMERARHSVGEQIRQQITPRTAAM